MQSSEGGYHVGDGTVGRAALTLLLVPGVLYSLHAQGQRLTGTQETQLTEFSRTLKVKSSIERATAVNKARQPGVGSKMLLLK